MKGLIIEMPRNQENVQWFTGVSVKQFIAKPRKQKGFLKQNPKNGYSSSLNAPEISPEDMTMLHLASVVTGPSEGVSEEVGYGC